MQKMTFYKNLVVMQTTCYSCRVVLSRSAQALKAKTSSLKDFSEVVSLTSVHSSKLRTLLLL